MTGGDSRPQSDPRVTALRARAEHVLDRIWYGESPWRWALWPLSGAFRALVSLRSLLYQAGVKRSIVLDVPVIVVGNVTAGGTGKTPLVIWLARELAARGSRPGIVTRGYGGHASSWPQRVTADSSPDLVGDEPVLLAARTGCPVFAGPDRVAAAKALLEKNDVDVLLSDDGLQHYRLARGFEIAVVDGLRGLGNGLCLPAGPLRESARRLGSVDAVVVNESTGSEQAAGRRGSALGTRRTGSDNSTISPVPMRLVVSRVYRIAGDETARLSDFAGRRVHAVAGIGHPERFFQMLERAGLIVLRHPLPDHARIELADLPSDAHAPVLTTEKDAVKMRNIARSDVWCVAVETVIDAADAERLLASIAAALGMHGAAADAVRR